MYSFHDKDLYMMFFFMIELIHILYIYNVLCDIIHIVNVQHYCSVGICPFSLQRTAVSS